MNQTVPLMLYEIDDLEEYRKAIKAVLPQKNVDQAESNPQVEAAKGGE